MSDWVNCLMTAGYCCPLHQLEVSHTIKLTVNILIFKTYSLYSLEKVFFDNVFIRDSTKQVNKYLEFYFNKQVCYILGYNKNFSLNLTVLLIKFDSIIQFQS